MQEFSDTILTLKANKITEIPVLEFARYLYNTDAENKMVALIGAAVMNDHLQGHICSEIPAICNTIKTWGFDLTEDHVASLSKSSVAIGEGKTRTPLVKDKQYIYLHRFWKYEQELSAWLKEKAGFKKVLESGGNKVLQDVFPDKNEHVSLQFDAVALSLTKKLMVLTGGPGTGKTYTVKKIIEAHKALNPDITIAMAAPTGKAAQRLNESLGESNYKAQTIHSLLGSLGLSGKYRYGTDNPLPFDMVIVDEASMMDLTIWIQMIRAVSEDTILILLGDKNQLASVEAGSIFGDICTAASRAEDDSYSHDSLSDCIVELTKSYRFKEGSGIHELSKAILDGDSKKALQIMEDPVNNEVQWMKPTSEVMQKVMDTYVASPFRRMKAEKFSNAGFSEKQILCALRKGPFGVEEMNNWGERIAKEISGVPDSLTWYHGRPVMIKRNERQMFLSNGEVGFAVPEPNGKGYKVQFENREDLIHSIRIPDHEPSHAITIHKSQGSEYEDVAILLTNNDNPLLSKELLYTGVTRARQSILVIGSQEQIEKCITTRIRRNSNLISRLT